MVSPARAAMLSDSSRVALDDRIGVPGGSETLNRTFPGFRQAEGSVG
jgi:hypothetical protein